MIRSVKKVVHERLHCIVRPTPGQSAERPVRERVHSQRIAARAALMEAAEQAGAILGPLETDANGAPLPTDGWHWSLSHTASLVAAVVSREPVGIDVEGRHPRHPGVWRRLVSEEEELLVDPTDPASFLRIWTAKEAVLKKLGVGFVRLSHCKLAEVPDADEMVLAHAGELHRVRQTWSLSCSLSVTADATTEVRWDLPPDEKTRDAANGAT